MWSSSPPPEGESVQSSRAKIVDDIVQVTCGALVAKMHTKLFVCPGIHQACIEFEDEMISPKQFTFKANKDKQKDWKGSIRIGRYSLRCLIASERLDFYNHSELCSSKCQSRNYINTKLSDIKPINTFAGQQMMSHQLHSGAPVILPGYYPPPSSSSTMYQSSFIDDTPPSTTVSPDIFSPNPPSLGNYTTAPAAGPTPDQHLLNLLHIDPLTFWRELQRVGILDGVVDHMVNAVSKMRLTRTGGGTNEFLVSLTLSRLVTSLNLQQEVISRIHTHQWEYLKSMQDDTLQQFGIDPFAVKEEDRQLTPDDTQSRGSIQSDQLDEEDAALMQLLGTVSKDTSEANGEDAEPVNSDVVNEEEQNCSQAPSPAKTTSKKRPYSPMSKEHLLEMEPEDDLPGQDKKVRLRELCDMPDVQPSTGLTFTMTNL